MSLAQESKLYPLCARQCGLCEATGVCGVHSWGQSSAPVQNPCPPRLPTGAEGHRGLVQAAGKLQSWALVPLLLLIGSATWVGYSASLASVYLIVKWGIGVRSPMITKISDHKERLREIQETLDSVSKFPASLCPLVDTISLAPRRKWQPAYSASEGLGTNFDFYQGSHFSEPRSPSLHVDNKTPTSLYCGEGNAWEVLGRRQAQPSQSTEARSHHWDGSPVISEECNDYKLIKHVCY